MRFHAALLGNGHTAALVEPDLSLSWLCIPRFDSQPLFAAALDPRRGGSLRLQVEVDGRPVPLALVHQEYVDRSAVLRTELAGDGIRLVSTDFMPWGKHGLVRRIRVDAPGRRVCLRLTADPVRSVHLPVSREEGLLRTADGTLLIRGEGLDPVGEEARVYLAWGGTTDAALAALREVQTASAEAELAHWADWIAAARRPLSVPPAWAEAYWRSLVVLRLLTYEPTGAPVAAATASLPAIPGGDHQWDYRYLWLRDGYYTAMAFDAAGLHREARRFYDFCFTLQGPDGHWQQPLYTVDGQTPHEHLIDDLAGPGGEVPVRLGNAASGQLQLDNEGSILHGLWFHYRCSGDKDALLRHWEGVRRAAEWTLANWQRRESGIWEIREYTGHWVHGKAMCYATLTSAARIARTLGYAEEAGRWAEAARRIAAVTVERGWDRERQAYVRHWGAEPPTVAPMDISVLALVFYGLLSPHDPRIRSTVEHMYRPADDGGLLLYGGVCRWENAAVPFYLPTFWLARYHLMAGEMDRCDQWVEACLKAATSLRLMAEHFDGRDGTQWGNFPQAFSHEEIVRLVIERSQGWTFFDWEFQD